MAVSCQHDVSKNGAESKLEVTAAHKLQAGGTK